MDYITILADPKARLLTVGAAGILFGGIKEGILYIKGYRATMKLKEAGVFEDTLNSVLENITEETPAETNQAMDTLDKIISDDDKLTWGVALLTTAGGVITAACNSAPIKGSYLLETGLDFVAGSIGSAIGKRTLGKLIGNIYLAAKASPDYIG